MNKILITGAYGQLGNALNDRLSTLADTELILTDHLELDITDPKAVDNFLCNAGFNYLINCAAYTAVDKAETDATAAAKLNADAVGILGEYCARYGVKVIHISTDYVFSGESFKPYNEKDEPYPQGIYGRTKLNGEGLLSSFCHDSVIIRTSWLYSEYGNNFVKTMLKKGAELGNLNVVADQIGSPTYAGDLADAICKVLMSDKWHPGIYHYSNEGVASWYDFAKAIFELSKMEVNVNPVPTTAYPTPAKRPHYSVLDKTKIKQTFDIAIPYWRDSLKKCLEILQDKN